MPGCSWQTGYIWQKNHAAMDWHDGASISRTSQSTYFKHLANFPSAARRGLVFIPYASSYLCPDALPEKSHPTIRSVVFEPLRQSFGDFSKSWCSGHVDASVIGGWEKPLKFWLLLLYSRVDELPIGKKPDSLPCCILLWMPHCMAP